MGGVEGSRNMDESNCRKSLEENSFHHSLLQKLERVSIPLGYTQKDGTQSRCHFASKYFQILGLYDHHFFFYDEQHVL